MCIVSPSLLLLDNPKFLHHLVATSLKLKHKADTKKLYKFLKFEALILALSLFVILFHEKSSGPISEDCPRIGGWGYLATYSRPQNIIPSDKQTRNGMDFYKTSAIKKDILLEKFPSKVIDLGENYCLQGLFTNCSLENDNKKEGRIKVRQTVFPCLVGVPRAGYTFMVPKEVDASYTTVSFFDEDVVVRLKGNVVL